MDYLSYILTFSTLGVFLWTLRRFGLMPFPSGAAAIFLCTEFTLLGLHEDLVRSAMERMSRRGGLDNCYIETFVVLFLASLGAALVCIGLRGRGAGAGDVIRNGGERVAIAPSWLPWFIYAYVIGLTLLVDVKVLLSHPYYLQSLVPMNLNQPISSLLAATMLRGLPIAGAASAACFVGLRLERRPYHSVIVGLCVLAMECILVGEHSRSAAFIPAVIGAGYLYLGLPGNRFVVPLAGLLALLFIDGALVGRSGNFHGVGSIPDTYARVFSSRGLEMLQDLPVEMFQGSWVIAESLNIPANFTFRYRILSFSPLPSLIDQYSTIRLFDQIRVNLFVPMSGFAEAIHFGWQYVLLLAGVFAINVRLVWGIQAKRPVLFMICNFLLMCSAYLLLAYPTRFALRYAWLAGILAFLSSFRETPHAHAISR